MKQKLVRFFAVIGFLVVSYIALVLVMVFSYKKSVPARTVLELDLQQEIVEYVPPEDALAKLLRREKLSTRDLVDALERAGNDDRVAGLVARAGSGKMGVAQLQEVRNAIQRFRDKKKFAIVYAETFGEFSNGASAYYLATAFDQIYLQPSGDVGLTGIHYVHPFIKNTLDKLGMRFHGDHRYEYKNALNLFTETKFTPAHREASEKMITSIYGQMVSGIAQARKMTPDQVRALIDKGPYLGKEAVDAGLVDKLAYRDEVYDEVKKKSNDAELLYLGKYLERAGRPHSEGKAIALVYGVGTVTRGKSKYDPMEDDTNMGSDTVAAAIRAAVADKDVKAIILRVDSPGGSYVASDTIWREVNKAKQAGKPVIACMGNVAASGGYFVSMNADKIVAQPGSITASIGVLSGKFLTKGLWDKLGVSFDMVAVGQNAQFWSGLEDYDPAEWARFQAWLDRIYVDFTNKVADGRKLPKDKVLQIAKGRVWTGEDAKALGLVDELGGFPEALKLAKQAAKIDEKEEVNVKVFPERKTFLQALLRRDEADNSEKEVALQLAVEALQQVQPIVREARRLGIGTRRDVLTAPDVEVRP